MKSRIKTILTISMAIILLISSVLPVSAAEAKEEQNSQIVEEQLIEQEEAADADQMPESAENEAEEALLENAPETEADPAEALPENAPETEADPAEALPENAPETEADPAEVMPDNAPETEAGPAETLPENAPETKADPAEILPENASAPEKETDDSAASADTKEPAEGILTEHADSGSCGDNITWTIKDGVLTLSGKGDIPDYPDDDPSYYTERERITSIVIKDGITGIGQYAFYDLRKVTEVTIPDTVTGIYLRAFQYCSALESVTIPKSVTIIGRMAFEYCLSLKTITFKGNPPSISSDSFNSVTATAVYPPADVWNSNVRKSYGGTLTWKADNKVGDNATWKLKSGVLTISGTGNTYDFEEDAGFGYTRRIDTPYEAFKDNIKSVVVENGVTRLGAYVFYKCSSLQSVTFPESLTEIGKYAFDTCPSLQSPTFPGKLKSIGYAAFSECTSIQSVTFPESLTEIGEFAFDGCSALKSSVVLPSGLTVLQKCAFRSTSLQSVTLPAGLTKIEREVFSGCESLASVTVPEGVTLIGFAAFRGCTSLKKVTLPESLKTIGEEAFKFCTSLPEIHIPKGVTEIGLRAFFIPSTSFEKITVAAGNPSFASVDGVLFSKQKTRLICYPGGKPDSTYEIPEGTEVIETAAFEENKQLMHVIFPIGVMLESAAFEYCVKLQKITLWEGMEEIPDYAFNVCRNVTELVIPASIKKLGALAFGQCSALKNIYFKGAPPQISNLTFYNVTANAYYPEALIDEWAPIVNDVWYNNLTWIPRHVDVTAMKFAKTTLEIPVGKTVRPQVTFTPEDGYLNLTWKSNAPGYVSVDENGNVTAKKVGKTNISASGTIGGKTVTIKCTVNVLFKDVTNKGYTPYTAIYALNAKDIVAGFSDGTFRPNDYVTRGQVLVFLWRSAGKPNPKTSTITFKDAADIKALGPQYEKAVLWGIEQGITEGFTDNTFRPNANCTRGQIVTFLWRYKGKPNPKSGYSGSFPDVPKTHTFYKAVSWAASYKITTGFTDGTFRPTANCTRGQCVAFIYRMLNL